ncbi:hypothetical protein [Paenibacillus sp. FSL K6-2524]|uniref:hypothetical protein n=1 Tax=Paenibacillus sp. FSL K6-2524 TaxID=2954516 RepID=UPI0030F9329C
MIPEIIQITLFDDINEDDIRKTKWLLGKHTDMIDLIGNYEYSLKQMKSGFSEYDYVAAEGSVAKRETGHELTADVTANSVILKDKRYKIYQFYLFITNNIKYAINNMRDPHENKIAELLFINGTKYLKAQEYMKKGYKKELYGISDNTFADKRRKAIANIATSLKYNRTLDFVTIDYGLGRGENGEIKLLLPFNEE